MMWQVTTAGSDALCSYENRTLASVYTGARLSRPEVAEDISQIYSNELLNAITLGSYGVLFGQAQK